MCYVAIQDTWSGQVTSQVPVLGTVPEVTTPRPSLLGQPSLLGEPKTGLLGDCPPEYRNKTQMST